MIKCSIKIGDKVIYIPSKDAPKSYPKRLPEGNFGRVVDTYFEGVIGLDKKIVVACGQLESTFNPINLEVV